MSRYIDSNAVMEVLERSAKDPRNETAMTSWANALQELIDLLDDLLIPIATADVVEVVHGEWKHDGNDLWHCSVCGNRIYSETKQDRDKFHGWCGMCGAYMRGKSNG